MNPAQRDELFAWFERYVEPFRDTDPEGRINIQLKIDHTRKVCAAMAELCEGEQLSPSETTLAVVVALLHDVGRFPQYRRWRTFRDSDSDNHARLAIEVIREERLLEACSPEEQLLIEEAIRFHNLLELPKAITSPTRRYIDLIRDADKLDIWRVFVDLLEQPPKERASAATLGLPDLPDMVTDSCVTALAAGRIVRLDTATCFNDFKLMQISWIYDLNSATARKLLRQRGYIPILAATLPQQDRVKSAVAQALAALSA